jgi:hypothetical protein
MLDAGGRKSMQIPERPMNLELLAVLKDKLVHAAKFTDVMNYFFDHFGEDPEFIALGEPTRNAFLEGVLAEVGLQMFGNQVAVMDLLLTRVPGRHFIHGGGALNGRMLTLLYFEDIAVGLVAVVAAAAPADTKLARFTGKPLTHPPGLDKPSPN